MDNVIVVFKNGVAVVYQFSHEYDRQAGKNKAQAFIEKINTESEPFEYRGQYIDPREVVGAGVSMYVDHPDGYE